MDVSWIKLATNTFKDEKIEVIEDQYKENKDTILVIWLKLLCLAGKENTNGVFMLTHKIPYSINDFATVFKRSVEDVTLAFDVLEKYEMINRTNGVVEIVNWSKYQQSIIKCDGFKTTPIPKNNKKNEQLHCNENIEVAQDTSNKNINNIKEQIKEVLEYWNRFSNFPKITKLTNKRESNILNRIKENGLENCKKAIFYANESHFLTGYNNKGWKASFDWIFSSPNNFIKVLEKNYNSNDTLLDSKYERNQFDIVNNELEEEVVIQDKEVEFVDINNFFNKTKNE